MKSNVEPSIDHAATSTFLVVTLVDVHLIGGFILAEVPVDVLGFDFLVFPLVVLILEEIDAIPSEDDSIKMHQFDGFGDFLSVDIKVCMCGLWLQEDLLVNSVEDGMVGHHVPSSEAVSYTHLTLPTKA